MRKLMVAAALVAAMGMAAQAASAQTAAAVKPIQIGVQADFATNNYGPGIGARVVYNGLGTTLKVPGLAAYASFDYFFPSSAWGTGLSFWEINANATYDLKLTGMPTIAPYVGGGLNYAHLSANCAPFSCSASNTGLNLLGGARFKVTPKLNAYLEARFELRSASAIVLTAGVLF
jgi:opacity protein-like surface antigen